MEQKTLIATLNLPGIVKFEVFSDTGIVYGQFGNDGIFRHQEKRSLPLIDEIPMDTDFIYFSTRYFFELDGCVYDYTDTGDLSRIFIGKKYGYDEIVKRYPSTAKEYEAEQYFIETVHGGVFPIKEAMAEGVDYFIR